MHGWRAGGRQRCLPLVLCPGSEETGLALSSSQGWQPRSRQCLQRCPLNPLFIRRSDAGSALFLGHTLDRTPRGACVRDYQQHGLRTPASGQEWHKAEGCCVLLASAAGVSADGVPTHR
ncbi:RcnB family protein [Stenotrophomonas sp. NPDC077659]|uniref:RcnB family protein n=1 Tax=Stenotrophomonas sp. NPDC077659 TaxID=3390694 RepID=UPI003CFEF80D